MMHNFSNVSLPRQLSCYYTVLIRRDLTLFVISIRFRFLVSYLVSVLHVFLIVYLNVSSTNAIISPICKITIVYTMHKNFIIAKYTGDAFSRRHERRANDQCVRQLQRISRRQLNWGLFSSLLRCSPLSGSNRMYEELSSERQQYNKIHRNSIYIRTINFCNLRDIYFTRTIVENFYIVLS